MKEWKDLKKLPEAYCDLLFDEAVTSWDEAVPLGNGLLGCLIWGKGNPLRLSLDRGDLWDTRPAPETLGEDFTYKKLAELADKKDVNEINRIFDDCYGRATPTKIPAGRLEINYGLPGDRVESCLRLKDACAEVKLRFGEKSSEIKTFLHATDLFGYIRISGNADLPQIKIKAPGFGIDPSHAGPANSDQEDETNCGEISKGNISNGSLELLQYPPVEWFEEGCLKWFRQSTAEGLEFGIFLGQREIQGTLDAVYYVASNRDGDGWLDNAKKRILKALETGFEGCAAEHRNWWHGFWSKSAVTLHDREFEKQWYMTNYMFGSCSRKGAPPMPLQGVWTADNDMLPPWKGDYHNDLNTQMSYYHYLKANHPEEGESFIDFLWELAPQARKFAGDFFDAPGLSLPAVMSIDGKPLGGWPMYSLNLTNQIWLCKSFGDYWKTTGDMNFLRERAYPWFRETALCIMRWLKADENGKLSLALSSSPEIHDNTLAAWLTPNSNYDLSLLMYLFKTLFEMSEALDNNEKEAWREKYEQLPELAVNKDNVLMLSPDESLNESHRHFAHAMAIHPLRLLDYDGSKREKEIIDATVSNLENLGMRWWVGFSFTWMAELYAIQRNGEAAAFQLKLFRENICSQNGFHLNGDYKNCGLTNFHYRPFTLESNMCAADALQEMLLQTHNGVISVFPAIPESWRKYGAAFGSFRGENGILVSSSIKNMEVEFISLEAQNAGTFKIKNVFNSEKLCIRKQDGNQVHTECRSNDIMDIALLAGEKCSVAVHKDRADKTGKK